MKNYCIKKGLFTWQYVTVFSRTEMMKNALKESISGFLKKIGIKKTRKNPTV